MDNGGDATRSNFIEILEVRGGPQQHQRRAVQPVLFSPLLLAEAHTGRRRAMGEGGGMWGLAALNRARCGNREARQ